MRDTVRAEVSAEVKAATIIRRAAPYILAAALSIGLIAAASSVALAKGRKPHPFELTGFGSVPRIMLPSIHDPAPPAAPARFFTASLDSEALNHNTARGGIPIEY